MRGLGELLTHLAEEVERPCLVIDEFGYLVELDRGVLSDLQAAWDEVLSRMSFFLVLCGSSVSMFEMEVLGYRSPLYGRRTGSWRVEPLSFRDARSFIPRYGFEDAVRVWAAAGGVPMHLRLFDDGLEFTNSSASPDRNRSSSHASSRCLSTNSGSTSIILNIHKSLNKRHAGVGKNPPRPPSYSEWVW